MAACLKISGVIFGQGGYTKKIPPPPPIPVPDNQISDQNV